MRIECVRCGKVKEVVVGRGRPRFFCDDKCRMAASREKDPDVRAEMNRKKEVIRRQYKEARKSSMNVTSLRGRAMKTLRVNGWSAKNIGIVFELTDERVRQITGGVPNGK